MAGSRTFGATDTPDLTPTTRRWIVVAARFGYLAKATVYGVIGILALLAAMHTGEPTTGTRGAFIAILSRPFGPVLLGILCAGLAAYALWRFTQAFLDSDQRGTHVTALLARIGMGGTALVYAGLSYSALRIF